jgi:hypothetical protein
MYSNSIFRNIYQVGNKRRRLNNNVNYKMSTLMNSARQLESLLYDKEKLYLNTENDNIVLKEKLLTAEYVNLDLQTSYGEKDEELKLVKEELNTVKSERKELFREYQKPEEFNDTL